ncbi:hypothetical protein L596_018953 [Steinernema carpocapsae]|uniref:VWFA domain-containing protein n=1 Tax=Steinernema carpocapsae TaxID=34508 RepID=A0A4U5N7K4_STECR|nr:hypothetical protein L596_018953 [Steinernema carpocapsae]
MASPALLGLLGVFLLSSSTSASSYCLKTDCNPRNLYADYVILIDSSRPMGQSNFDALKKTLTTFTNDVRIGSDSDNVQMQFITYSMTATSHGTLQQGSNAVFVNQTINSLTFDDFGTREITKALQVEQSTVNVANGWRAGAKHILVLFSADSFTGTLPESNGLLAKVRSKYDMLLAVGIGSSAIKNTYLELEQFAGTAEDTMFLSSADQLQYAKYWLAKNGCSKSHMVTTTQAPTPAPTQAPSVTCQLKTLAYDIYLLIDSSIALSTSDFQGLKNQLVSFVQMYNIADSASQFGLTTVSIGAELFYTGIRNGQTKDSFISKIKILTQDGTNGQTLKLAFQSIEHAYLKKFDTSKSPQLAIYVTSNTDFDTAPYDYIKSLKSKYGLKTLAVRYSSSADASLLAQVAGGAACVYDATSSPKAGMVAWLQEATCKKSFC